MTDSILYIKEKNVGRITLNRPAVFNSFNREMALRLQQVLDDVQHDKEVRAVYLTGEGKAFCAGQDLAEVTDPNAPFIDKIVGEHYNPIVERIRNLEKPVVAAVNGVAAGAGANIALACDVVVASENASFIQAFSKIGLIPDSAGTFFLPRIIGFQKASALMMLGDKIKAKEAEHLGMLFKVFSEDVFGDETYKIAVTLSQMPTKGLAYTKQLLNRSYSNNLTEQLAMEEEFQAKAGQTYDYKEGVQAFMEKRKPEFKGE